MLVAVTIMFEMIEDYFPAFSLSAVPLICECLYLIISATVTNP